MATCIFPRKRRLFNFKLISENKFLSLKFFKERLNSYFLFLMGKKSYSLAIFQEGVAFSWIFQGQSLPLSFQDCSLILRILKKL